VIALDQRTEAQSLPRRRQPNRKRFGWVGKKPRAARKRPHRHD